MKLSWGIFWALVAVFAIITIVVFTPPVRGSMMGFHFLIISGAVFCLLGASLIFWAVKGRVEGLLGKFLILTGASAVGVVLSAVLHNVTYGLFIHWFGANLWDRIGLLDEPLFSFLAIAVCPAAFVVGAVASIVLAIKRSSE